MRLRSFLLGLVTGVAVLGLSASPAKAQYTWQSFRTDQNWLLEDNWNIPDFPGDTNTAIAAEGLATDTALFGARAFAGPIGINFSNLGQGNGSGSGDGNAAAATGRLTLLAFGLNGGTALTVGNSAVGAAAGEFNGILQLNSGSLDGVANSVLRNTSGQTLTIARNIVPANAANADMAVRVNAANSVISLSGNSTIDIQTQLVMSTAVDRRITVDGAGTVILGADNTQGYTAAFGQGTYVGLQGGWTLNNGAILRVAGNNNLGINPAAATANYLQMGNGTLRADASFTLDSNRGITLTSLTAGQAGTLHVEGAATDLTYDGFITGAGNFAKAGAGDLFLSQQQTYTGSTTVSGGRLEMTGTGRLPTNSIVLMTGANTILDIDNTPHTLGGLGGGDGGATSQVLVGTNALTIGGDATPATAFRGIIVGSGGLVKNGNGSTTLANVQPYTGGTTINAGTLQLGDGTTTGTIIGGVLNNGNLAFNPAVAGNTFSEVISGTGTVTKLGAGVQTLSAANTYTGRTSVNAGTLAITADNNLGTAPGAPTPGHLVLNGGALRADATFTLDTNRGIALGPTTGAGNGTINVAPTFTLTYGGVMDDQGGTGSFFKTGTGTLVLSDTQLYAGSTTVDNGTLRFSVSGGTNRLPGTALTVGGGTNTALLDLNGNNQAVTNLSGGVNGTIDLGNGTLTVNPTVVQTFAGAIIGAGGLVKDGANAQILSGANTFTGPITINAGTLQVGAGATGSIVGSQAITNAGTLTFSQNFDQTVSGNITGAGVLNKLGTGTLTLSGNNTYTGATNVTGGLRAGSTSAFGNGSPVTITADNSILQLNGFSNTIGSLASAANATRIVENASATAATLTTGGNNTNTTFSGLIRDGAGGGALAVTKVGTGTFTLTGTHTYTGGTTVNAGVLQLGNNTTNGLVAGNITNDANVTFNTGGGNNTYAGVISGTGSLTKIGANTLTLSGANTFTGPITVSTGTLQVGSGATGSIAGTQAIDNAGTLAFNQNFDQTVSGNITGAGGLTKAGTGVLTLSGNNSYTGATTITGGVLAAGSTTGLSPGSAFNLNANDTTLRLGGFSNTIASLATSAAAATRIVENASATAATLTLGGNASTTFGGVMRDGTGGGALALTKNGTGTLTLTGANTYTGGTTINAGTVRIGAAGAIPDAGTVTIGGGTLSTAPTAGGAGISEVAGVLRTIGSTIALGTGVHTLTFNGLAPANELTSSPLITGWTGGHFLPGTQGRILFNNLTGDPNATYSTWLSGVQFAGNPTGGFFTDAGASQFELVPVPEPGTVLGIAAAGLAGLGLIRRRFRRDAGAMVAA